jgi:hypothetical protein
MGSSDYDHGYAIAVDGSGNVYVVGDSDVTWGTPANAHAGNRDVFAAKLDSNGSLQWNTFIGSSSIDGGEAIVVDGNENVYVAGESYATWGTPVNLHAGGYDAYAAKLVPDLDGDGYGVDTDCDDGNAAINPGASEVCDGVDNNCDGNVDEGVTITFYQDSDGDGYGNAAISTQDCSAPVGYVADNTDCDDGDAAINPAATEVCDDGIDNDCDGDIDSSDADCGRSGGGGGGGCFIATAAR